MKSVWINDIGINFNSVTENQINKTFPCFYVVHNFIEDTAVNFVSKKKNVIGLTISIFFSILSSTS